MENEESWYFSHLYFEKKDILRLFYEMVYNSPLERRRNYSLSPAMSTVFETLYEQYFSVCWVNKWGYK